MCCATEGALSYSYFLVKMRIQGSVKRNGTVLLDASYWLLYHTVLRFLLGLAQVNGHAEGSQVGCYADLG
jgi:hypothetical protein